MVHIVLNEMGMIRYLRLVFVLACFAFTIILWLERKQGLHNSLTATNIDLDQHDHYDVVLSSYMRGGSTLTGIVLGHRSDSFYVYEPLWKIARWVYWRGNDTVCRSDTTECRELSADRSPDAGFMHNRHPNITGSLTLAQKLLYQIYDCQFNDIERLMYDPRITARLGGPSWSCLKGKEQKTSCIHQNILKVCKNATHRVTKVLRFTTDNFEPLLQSRKNLKIIHLFRDPRAIINSRIETNWYPSKGVLPNAESLCKKMMVDYQEGKKLSINYPNRFRFLYYEDLNTNPLDKVETIYRYLGMSVDKSKYSIVKSIPVFDSSKDKVQTEREKNTAYWWRKKLKLDLVQKIDNLCKDVYDALGYRAFHTYHEMQNLTFKSVEIPLQFALSTIVEEPK